MKRSSGWGGWLWWRGWWRGTSRETSFLSSINTSRGESFEVIWLQMKRGKDRLSDDWSLTGTDEKKGKITLWLVLPVFMSCVNRISITIINIVVVILMIRWVWVGSVKCDINLSECKMIKRRREELFIHPYIREREKRKCTKIKGIENKWNALRFLPDRERGRERHVHIW